MASSPITLQQWLMVHPESELTGPWRKEYPDRYVIGMVGLPARGKTLISNKMVRYLRWQSINAKSFNVGSYRRTETPHPSAEFFDFGNTEGEKLRKEAAVRAVKDMVRWFREENGVVAILDATNSTVARRAYINGVCKENKLKLMFIEIICDIDEIIFKNVQDVKTRSPDYVGISPDEAVKDFFARIAKYESVYETVDGQGTSENNFSYLKLKNLGRNVIINRVNDYLPSRITYFVRNLHIRPRTIWLSRHGESEFNLEGKIGGDADLSARGHAYALKLPDIVKASAKGKQLKVWTSTLKRTGQTAQYLPYTEKREWKALDELFAGHCDGLTYEEIEQQYPEDFKARDEDKFNYRYRGGESYADVIQRLEPIIMELEREENVLIVTHQAVIRCLYAYFMNTPQNQSPWVEIPLHTLIELKPDAYQTWEKRHKAHIPAVSTFRTKGSSAKHQETDSPGAHEPGVWNPHN